MPPPRRELSKIEAIEFPQPQLLVAAAPNATGKTNFLESIVWLLRGKSWRASNEQCVCWGEEHCLVKGVIHHQNHTSTLTTQFQLYPRRLKIEEDSLPISPVTFYTQYPLITFLPEDTFLFSRGPAGRRNFLNQALVVTPNYLSILVQYHRALRQRNSALKTAPTANHIQGWTDLIVEYAIPIWQQRLGLIDFLNTHLPSFYQDLMNESISFSARLLPGLPSVQTEEVNTTTFQAILERVWEQEKRYAYTLFGPHRDEFEITVEGRGVAQVLSRGQMRGLVLALKLVIWQFTKQLTGEPPLMLLDDVLSELDEVRQESLLSHLPQAQILLTCTSLPASLRQRDTVQFLDLRNLLHASTSTPAIPVAQAA